jgi:hypothetical protein
MRAGRHTAGRGRKLPAGKPATSGVADSLKQHLKQRRQIALVWTVDDVLSVRPDLSGDQAWTVLQLVDDQHDASLGVTWETIEDAAQSLFPQKGGVA